MSIVVGVFCLNAMLIDHPGLLLFLADHIRIGPRTGTWTLVTINPLDLPFQSLPSPEQPAAPAALA